MTHLPAVIKILIADEEGAFRQSLRSTLDLDRSIRTVGEAGDIRSVIEMLGSQSADVLLLDFALSQSSGFRDALASSQELRSVRTLVMMTAADQVGVIEAFRLGAQGVVLKNSGRAVWRRSLRAVAAGKYWVGDESMAALINAVRDFLHGSPATSGKRFGLTPRELEIVEKIADGHSNKDVGAAFSICERTVKHHLTNIFDKVGVSSRLELAVFARDQHVVSARALRPPALAKAQKASE